MSNKQKDYKAWITRKINTALSLLIEADEIYVEMYGGGYCDYHEASAIDCYIERARLTAHEALDFMKSLPDETPNELPNTNGGGEVKPEERKRLFNKDVPFITYIIHDKNMKNGRTVTVYKPTQEYYILFELIKFRRLPATFPDIGITVIDAQP